MKKIFSIFLLAIAMASTAFAQAHSVKITANGETVNNICLSTTCQTIYLVAHSSGFNHPKYQWQSSTNNTWNDIPGAKDDTLIVTAASFTGPTLSYRVSVTEGNSTDKCYSTSICVNKCGALPLKVIFFTGFEKNNIVQLNWNVLIDDVLSFEVERSIDGANFTTITTVAKNSNGGKLYKATDISVSQSGYLYYRLKGIERDGSVSFTNIVKIAMNGKNVPITIGPIPFVDHIKIVANNLENQTKTKVIFTDINGKKVRETLFGNGDIYNLGNLQPGVYSLQIIGDKEILHTQKVVKQ